MDFSNFLAKMKEDNFQLSKPFLYEVMLLLPDTSSSKFMSLLCHQAQIPGWNINTQRIKIYGIDVEMPYEFAFTEFQMSFYVDRALEVVQALQGLRNNVVNMGQSEPTASDYSIDYFDNYVFNTVIIVYDIDNKTPAATYTLTNCMIKSLTALNLDWSAQNQVQQCNVAMTFEYMQEGYATKSQVPETPNVAETMGGLSGFLKNLPMPLNFDSVRMTSPTLAAAFDTAKSAVTINNGIGSNVSKTLSSFF